ncbi:MAG: RusA family crossover junction endodeoxyribonuclease [Pseudomonadota bacterium]
MNAPTRIATIILPKPISVNAMYRNRSKAGKRGRQITERYRTWFQSACSIAKGLEDGKATPLPSFSGPVSISLYVPEPNTKLDLDNTAKAYLDLFVKLGVIPDDNRQVVRRLSLQWVTGDRGYAAIEPMGAA